MSPNAATAESTLSDEVQRLRLRERHLLSLLNSARDAVLAMDAQGHVVDWNPGAIRLLGWSEAEALGHKLSDLIIPPEHRDAHENGLRRYLATGETRILDRLVEVQAQRKDGSQFPVELSVWRIEADGELKFGAFLRDITERQAVQAALQRTSSEREAILNTALVGIAYHVRRRIVWLNQKYAEMTGYSRHDLIGQSSRIFYDDDAAWEADGEVFTDVLERDGQFTTERQIRRRDGRQFWALLAGRCVVEGHPEEGVIWTLLDITERKQADEETKAALAQQKELNDLRSRFVAMTSHEFRTPLATILSSAELLRFYGDRMEEAEKLDILQNVENSVQRMTRMLERVLMIGKSDANMLEFDPHALDLAALCHSLVDQARTQHPDSPCQVQVDLAPGVAQGRYDEKLLRHIFGNLLSNAIKYSPRGGTVRFRITSHQGRTEFTVADEGIGIPVEELPHLFESFHRASNVGDIPGTGLGLAIVKKSVELHGGEISVDSRCGAGTTFTVRL